MVHGDQKLQGRENEGRFRRRGREGLSGRFPGRHPPEARLSQRRGELERFASAPGNRLEALKGDRHGQYSIRVNDQWRICFVWTPDGPKDVEFVDYH